MIINQGGGGGEGWQLTKWGGGGGGSIMNRCTLVAKSNINFINIYLSQKCVCGGGGGGRGSSSPCAPVNNHLFSPSLHTLYICMSVPNSCVHVLYVCHVDVSLCI